MNLRAHLQRLASALSAVATIAVLVVGVPAALWFLSASPLPSDLTSWSELGRTLTDTQVSDGMLVKVIACIGWLTWSQVVTSFLVEVAAWLRGKPSRRVRTAGPIQPMMRKLIATAALVLSTSHISTAAFASPPLARPAATAPIAYATSEPRDEKSSAELNQSSSSTAIVKSHTVVRYDTLWGLAERHLGDPLRWREIFELTRGRPQPDGRTLTDPNLIVVGWTVYFPSDANGLDPQESGTNVDLGVPTPPVPTTAIIPTTIGAPANTTAGAVTTTTTASRPSSVAALSTTTVTTPVVAAPAAETKRDTNVWPLVGGGLAAAGLVALLSRLRRVQQRRRPIGVRPPTPPPEFEQIERRIRHAADPDAAVLLDAALRAFAAGATGDLAVPPHVLAVRVGGRQVELLLASPPFQSPKGFVATGDDRGWTTEYGLTTAEMYALAAGKAAPLPSLVSLGELDGDHLLIDIETAGLLTIDGDDNAAVGLLQSIATQLATATWIDHVDVILVGELSAADVVGAARVRRVPEIGAAIEELESIAASFSSSLDTGLHVSTLDARISGQPNDGWIPTILICTDVTDRDCVDRLAVVTANGGRGVGAILRSTHRAIWHAQLTATTLMLAPLGFEVTSSVIDKAAARSIDALLTDAAVGDTNEAEPFNNRPIADVQVFAEEFDDQPFEIEIRILGTVEVFGTTTPVDRRKSVELATYLALHPRGVTDDRIKTILWPNDPPTDGTFNTTVSQTRSKLGHATDGSAHFPRFSDAGLTYRLGHLVTTDLARFEARAAHARYCEAPEAIALLRSALELVRGHPFEGTRGYEWAFSEGHVACAEASVADAAHQLAQLCLSAGDPAGAIWAAMQGLKASPGDETLYRDRMLACDLAGNPAGVESAMDELCEVVETLEPYDSLHAETLALYDRTSHRRRARPKT